MDLDWKKGGWIWIRQGFSVDGLGFGRRWNSMRPWVGLVDSKVDGGSKFKCEWRGEGWIRIRLSLSVGLGFDLG